MKQNIALIALIFGVLTAHAQESVPTPAPVDAPVARERNFFMGSGTRVAQTIGMSVFYHVKITDQFMIGNSLLYGVNNDEDSGGDLDSAQYYKDEYELRQTMLDLNATYYFREHGYRLWGFLMRGGFGHSWNYARNKWGRYDRDPGFFIWGDDKRLRESSERKNSFNTTFIRLGAYYQFAFNFNSMKRTAVGHVLEVGAGVIHHDRGYESAIAKPNGTVDREEFHRTSALVEVNYSLAF